MLNGGHAAEEGVGRVVQACRGLMIIQRRHASGEHLDGRPRMRQAAMPIAVGDRQLEVVVDLLACLERAEDRAAMLRFRASPIAIEAMLGVNELSSV